MELEEGKAAKHTRIDVTEEQFDQREIESREREQRERKGRVDLEQMI